jgi:formylglycine-generating enzyme required for sulfatase activity
MKERAKKAVQEVVYAAQGGYELVWIPGNAFMMGSPPSEKGRFDFEGPQHQVRVPEFYMGRYPGDQRGVRPFSQGKSEGSGTEILGRPSV